MPVYCVELLNKFPQENILDKASKLLHMLMEIFITSLSVEWLNLGLSYCYIDKNVITGWVIPEKIHTPPTDGVLF